MPQTILRGLATGSHFMIFASAAIVTGLISHFLHQTDFRNAHLVYEEVIATTTLAFYMIAQALPFIKSYRGYLLPLNLIFSYLWLTSFIFTAQDWSMNRCLTTAPQFPSQCGKRHAVEAFTFLAFIFLVFNVIIEGLLWSSHSREKSGSSPAAEAAAA
ncbi:hypothetical protein G6O67_004199 [Ophiocordyceps sinensis]|uniref:MARVEL domain-containing protein n=2 Tax=Ophiocordyceps sinensis TaxID=72228 RepID=A0A8H4LZK0_9HYPO|nr:might be a transmembrane protein [Ophiocordyceps sinensis CO18]KAF4507732.1 hypothetical protein G6O67_004199 [Ophiocordyceps sinensis]